MTPPPPHTHTHGRIFQMPVLPNMHGLRRRVNWGDIKLSGLLDIPFKKKVLRGKYLLHSQHY